MALDARLTRLRGNRASRHCVSRASLVAGLLSLASIVVAGGCGTGASSSSAGMHGATDVERVSGTENPASSASESHDSGTGAGKSEPVSVSNPPAIKDITFDTIKFDQPDKYKFDEEMITPAIHALVGQPIRIRGFILPASADASVLTDFIFVRDDKECCFGPSAALYDCIVVEMEEGRSAKFSVRPIAVEGIFSVRILRENPEDKKEHPLAIYHLKATSAK